MKKVAFFDFDGTISKSDSMIDFINSTFGRFALIKGLLILSPFLLLYKLKLYNAQKAKEKLLSYFFKGKSLEELKALGDEYGSHCLERIVRDAAVERIAWHKQNNHDVYVVSASANIWLNHWCKSNKVELICTKLEFDNMVFQGKILGNNCNGKEKLKRIKQEVNVGKYDYVFCYGDSKGDKYMLEFADEPYYKPFQ